jgi:hypothetical protein
MIRYRRRSQSSYGICAISPFLSSLTSSSKSSETNCSTSVVLNRQAGIFFSNRMLSSPYDRPLRELVHYHAAMTHLVSGNLSKQYRKDKVAVPA